MNKYLKELLLSLYIESGYTKDWWTAYNINEELANIIIDIVDSDPVEYHSVAESYWNNFDY